jgi:hypothetical protein
LSRIVRAVAEPRPLRDSTIERALLRLLRRLGCGVAPTR